jgi:glycine/D-amino acid oxidase-like deaminating enzyme
MTVQADILVIGPGVMGAGMACHLSRHGAGSRSG